MAFNIVNGFTGLPHNGPKELTQLAIAFIGASARVCDWKQKFAVTVSTDGRTATVGAGALSVNGWLVTSDEAVTLPIAAGVAGQKRNDIVVGHVVKDGTDINLGTQTFELAVIKGASTTGTPTDPKDDNPDSVPLYRIPLDGVTVGTPVALFTPQPTINGMRDSLTQPLLTAKFKWQNASSFRADRYGGAMRILVDRANRLLHVDLSGFQSTVTLSDTFPVFLPESGVRPSADIQLGCLWSLPSGTWGKQAIWQTDGKIAVIGNMTNGDRCLHTPKTLPIPDGVTFA